MQLFFQTISDVLWVMMMMMKRPTKKSKQTEKKTSVSIKTTLRQKQMISS
jgi:hypothetical protein